MYSIPVGGRATFYGASPSSARKHAAPNDWIGPGSRKVLRPFLGAVRDIWLLRDRPGAPTVGGRTWQWLLRTMLFLRFVQVGRDLERAISKPM
jgi:hypothetical protein